MRLDRLVATATAGLAVMLVAGCATSSSSAVPSIDSRASSGSVGVAPGQQGGATSTVEQPSSTATSGSSGSAQSETPRAALNCSNVFEAVWPVSADRPSPSGWRGPTCSTGQDGLLLTWTYAGGVPAPEVTDAAFVALQKNFRSAGWTVDEAGSSDKDGQVVATSQIHSADGRDGVITYVSAGAGPATLSVGFTA